MTVNLSSAPKRSPWSHSWKLALQTLKRHKRRAFAMGTTLMIGVLAITLTIATGEGARLEVERSFRSMLGSFDVLMVMPGQASQQGGPQDAGITSLTVEDIQTLGASVPNIRDVSMAQASYNIDIAGNGATGTTSVWAVTPNWTSMRGDSISAGSTFSTDEVQSMARVAIIGHAVAETYLSSGSPLDQEIRIGGNSYKVVGTLAPQGAGPGGANMDNIVYIPLETGQRRFFNRDYIDFASLKLIDPSKWEETQGAVISLMRQRHGIAEGGTDDFRVSSPAAMISQYKEMDSLLRTTFLWVGVIALAIGAAIIASLMYSATRKRRKEIGLRRALGATEKDILAQFWSEAIVIAGIAAVIGVVIGLGVTKAAASMMRIQLAVSWSVTLGAAIVTMLIGAAAGYFPARKGAGEHPGMALRETE